MLERFLEGGALLTDSIVHSLVDRWSNPAPFLTCNDYLCNLICCEIAQTQLNEFAFFVHIVEGFKGLCEWYGAVCSMQIEDVNAIGLQGSQRLG